MESIFVQIPSFRDSECQWTVRDLFEKAAEPERISVGICLQYDADEDADCFELETRPSQVRSLNFHWKESRGVCWARHQAQSLWQGEDYVLSIDSHTRFVPRWDEKLITQLAQCSSSKPVLSSFPSGYIPPDTLHENAMPNILVPNPFDETGSLRVRGVSMNRKYEIPMRGAFVTPSFMFSGCSFVKDIPYDPYMYFGQEELSVAVRLFTHGYDVFAASENIVYHYYNNAEAADKKKLLHWTNNAEWISINDAAAVRLNHLVGNAVNHDPAATQNLDTYGLGTQRTVAEFEAFTGLTFSGRQQGEVAPQGKTLDTTQPNTPVETFPELVFQARSIVIGTLPTSAARLDSEVPAGVMMIHNYLSKESCASIVEFAQTQPYRWGGVIDLNIGGHSEQLTQQRIATHVALDPIIGDVLGIFNDIYCNRVSPFYDVDFEWYERPALIRYPVGGKYMAHADSESWIAEHNRWERFQDRDFSVVLWLNEEFEGGEFEFVHQGFKIRPRAGTLVAFPADHRYVHAVLPTLSGTRYAFANWGAAFGFPRIAPSQPYAAVYLRQGRHGQVQTVTDDVDK